VIEVAYRNESEASLRTTLKEWMLPTTSVQVAIGVKIFPVSRRIVAFMCRRAAPPMMITTVECGANVPHAPIIALVK
jgi:hypothetical protein